MDDVVFVGMDLGTFKTSIACSNGLRESFPTAVGWPKDHVAREMLGRDVVFGRDIVGHRLALEVVRPFEGGVLKYIDGDEIGMSAEQQERYRSAARLVVEHAVSLVKPDRGRVYGVIGAPSRAGLLNKQFLLEIAQPAFDLVAIVPEPFVVAYGASRLHNTLVIDIGAGTIDICPMYGAFPTEEDQVTVPFGGDIIDEDFRTRMLAEHPQAGLSLNMARDIKERYGSVCGPLQDVMVSLPVSGRAPREFNVAQPLRAACETIVPRIVDGVRESIGRFDPEFQESIIGQVMLSGGGGQLNGLDQALEQAFASFGEIRVTRATDTLFAGATGGLRLAMGMPDEMWQGLQQADQASTRSPGTGRADAA